MARAACGSPAPCQYPRGTGQGFVCAPVRCVGRPQLGEDAALGTQAQREDKEAGRAMDRHPQPPNLLRARFDKEAKDVQAVILHAASILPLWPKASKAELQAARPATVAHAGKTIDRMHLWACVSGTWQCHLCFAATFSDDDKQHRSREECSCDPAAVQRVVPERCDHLLTVADVDGGPCLFCAACGAWCTTKPRDFPVGAEAPAQRLA